MQRRRLIVLVAAAAMTVLLPASAMGRPPAENMGCPEGHQWMVVGEGEADRPTPYHADDPANGGNGDGIVCARAAGDGFFHDYPGRPDTVYWWSDNCWNDNWCASA